MSLQSTKNGEGGEKFSQMGTDQGSVTPSLQSQMQDGSPVYAQSDGAQGGMSRTVSTPTAPGAPQGANMAKSRRYLAYEGSTPPGILQTSIKTTQEFMRGQSWPDVFPTTTSTGATQNVTQPVLGEVVTMVGQGGVYQAQESRPTSAQMGGLGQTNINSQEAEHVAEQG